MKPIVVVTGKNGQLGWELQQLASSFQDSFEFVFTDRTMLDLAVPASIAPFFEKIRPQFFINCAAYTAVDKAETEKELALIINATSVGEIASCCAKFHTKLITISTDYVFDGQGTAPYSTTTPTHPVNYYGNTKAIGEQKALENNPNTIIIRTSWVYSAHGNNFVKTMLRLMKERPEIKVVNDQEGCPTYAADLAEALIKMGEASLIDKSKPGGIYHYSNYAHISWFNFAEAIRDYAGLNCEVNPIPSSSFPTPAKRPSYSVMDLKKIEDDFQITIKDWQERLKVCMLELGY